MFNIFNKSDAVIKQDVLNELMWDPSVSSSAVKVSAHDGVVTLTGTVPHYIEKKAAEHAAQRVGGVRGIADELEVKGIFDKTDEEIARVVLNALKWNYSVPYDIKVAVEKGWLTLEGEAEWEYERNAAKDAVSELLGVHGVTNNIKLKSKAQSTDIKARIEEALKRSAEAEGREISVLVSGDKVTLSGKIHSFSESEVARTAAWNAPGVMSVVNNLNISQHLKTESRFNMAKDRSAEDTISENEYTIRMRSISTRPENDSPGDSESDAGQEFEMGLEYMPNEKNDPEMVFDDANEADEKSNNYKKTKRSIIVIPDTAKVVSSEQPAPWMDQDKPSSIY